MELIGNFTMLGLFNIPVHVFIFRTSKQTRSLYAITLSTTLSELFSVYTPKIYVKLSLGRLARILIAVLVLWSNGNGPYASVVGSITSRCSGNEPALLRWTRSAAWIELCIDVTDMIFRSRVQPFFSGRVDQTRESGGNRAYQRTGLTKYAGYPCRRFLSCLPPRPLAALIGTRYRGFAAFLARSNCLKTAKLRRLLRQIFQFHTWL